MVIDPSSQYAYISNIYADNVAVLDIAARKVIATVPSGAGPNGISFSTFAPPSPAASEIPLELPTMDNMNGQP